MSNLGGKRVTKRMNMSRTLRRPFHSASHSIIAVKCNQIWEEIKLQQISHQAAPILPLWTSRWHSQPSISHKANSNWRSRSRLTAFLTGPPSAGRLSLPSGCLSLLSGLAKTLGRVEVLPSEYAVCVRSSNSIAQSNSNQCRRCGHWTGHRNHQS